MANGNDFARLFGGVKTKQDFDREAEAFDLKRQVVQAQLRKANQFDVDRLGEMAFYKAAQGQPLSQEELAAAKFVDAKSGGIQFDPVTGAMIQKPRLSDKIGLPGMTPGGNAAAGAPRMAAPAPNMFPAPDGGGQADPNLAGVPKLPIGNLPDVGVGNDGTQPIQPQNEFQAAYEQAMAQAAGNPKMQQQIKQQYMKDTMSYDQDQAKSAGFADRMANSNPVFDDPKALAAAGELYNRGASKIPILGNYLVSKDYQKFDQARRDFTTAQLRRESGATIQASEEENADKQYLPQPGDSKEVLAQKALNRQTAEQAMQRAAGAMYKPRTNKLPPSQIPMQAIQELKADPSPQARAEFDAAFGAGYSQQILGR